LVDVQQRAEIRRMRFVAGLSIKECCAWWLRYQALRPWSVVGAADGPV